MESQRLLETKMANKPVLRSNRSVDDSATRLAVCWRHAEDILGDRSSLYYKFLANSDTGECHELTMRPDKRHRLVDKDDQQHAAIVCADVAKVLRRGCIGIGLIDRQSSPETLVFILSGVIDWMQERHDLDRPSALRKVTKLIRRNSNTEVSTIHGWDFGVYPTLFTFVTYRQDRIKDAVCATCGEAPKKIQLCSRCGIAAYCGTACQRSHWSVHKQNCRELRLGEIPKWSRSDLERLYAACGMDFLADASKGEQGKVGGLMMQ